MPDKKNGMMFVMSSPSGAGKTTLTKKLAKNNSNFKISISHTTRLPRPNEINGQDYHFVSKNQFDELIKGNSFFEYARIFGNWYGTLKAPVLKFLSDKTDVLFDIDWQGTQQLKKNSKLNSITIFVLPPNIKTLKERLLNRHEGQEKIIKNRMKKFNEEVSHWDEYDYVVINDDLELCYNKILDIISLAKKGIVRKKNSDEIQKKVNELTQ